MKYYSVHRHKLSCVEVSAEGSLCEQWAAVFWGKYFPLCPLTGHRDTGKNSQDRTWEMDRGHKSSEGEIQTFRVRTPAWDLLLAVMATAWQHMLPISHSNLQWFDWPKIVSGGRYRHTSSIKMLTHTSLAACTAVLCTERDLQHTCCRNSRLSSNLLYKCHKDTKQPTDFWHCVNVYIWVYLIFYVFIVCENYLLTKVCTLFDS